MSQKLSQVKKMCQRSTVSNASNNAHKIKTENWPLESIGCRSLGSLTRVVLMRWYYRNKSLIRVG